MKSIIHSKKKQGIIKKKSCVQGFTLLEVLVALAIFSISAATLIVTSAQSIKNLQHIKERVLASWIAEDELKQILIKKEFPKLGSKGESKKTAHMNWYVKKEVLKTETDLFRSIKITIYLGDTENQEAKIYQLNSFVRRVKS